MVVLAALLWALGLSLRDATAFLSHLGLCLSQMRVLGGVRALKEEVLRRLPLGPGCWGEVEMGGGLPLLVLAVEEKDLRAVASALHPWWRPLGWRCWSPTTWAPTGRWPRGWALSTR